MLSNTVNINQGADPGAIYIPGYGGLVLDQWLEDVVYDSVELTGTTNNGSFRISSGTEFEYFVNIQNKNDIHTNMTESQKLPEGWEMIIMKMGLMFDPGLGDTATDLEDVIRLIEHSFIRFETGNSKVRRRAPSFACPIGFGLWANSSAGAQSVAGIGMPALAYAPNLLVPIRISSRLNFKAVLEVSDNIDISTNSPRTWFILYGFVSQPVG